MEKWSDLYTHRFNNFQVYLLVSYFTNTIKKVI